MCNSLGNILDLIFLNSNIHSISKAPSSLIFPDPYHPPLLLNFYYPHETKVDIKRSYYDFKNGDFNSISNFLNYFNWEATFSNYSMNDGPVVFNDSLLNSIEKFIPKKKY